MGDRWTSSGPVLLYLTDTRDANNLFHTHMHTPPVNICSLPLNNLAMIPAVQKMSQREIWDMWIPARQVNSPQCKNIFGHVSVSAYRTLRMQQHHSSVSSHLIVHKCCCGALHWRFVLKYSLVRHFSWTFMNLGWVFQRWAWELAVS